MLFAQSLGLTATGTASVMLWLYDPGPKGDLAKMNNGSTLATELAFFDSKKDEWLQHYEGQFVLVKDDQLLGVFPSQSEAVQAGLSRLGNVPFLVKQVLQSEPIATNPSLVLGLLYAHR
jgi:hypothetical protein